MIGSDELPLFEDSTSWEAAQARLSELGLGDGLPLVPPTRRRIERMLAGVGAPDRSHGEVPPLYGDLTAAAVAYNCVLAGCEAAELPVVLTAVHACLDPVFNLLGIQTTTGTPAVAAIVHGPAARGLGLNDGTNCLGPGNRANACIGRAIQLVLANVGGARPGIGDMATMGQPGKYTFCFAEGADPPMPPLHVRRGFAAGDSAVTVLGVSGTAEVLPAGGGDTPESILQPLLAAMASARCAAGAGRTRPPGEQFFLLPPELVQRIVGQDWNLRAIRAWLFDRRCTLSFGQPAPGADDSAGARPAAAPEDIHPVVAGGAGIKMTYLPLWMGGTRSVTAALLAP